MRRLALAAIVIALAAPPASAAVHGWGENVQGQLGSGYRSAPQNPLGTVGLPTELRLQDANFGPETVTGTPLA